LARALDGATVSGGEARQTRVVGAAHLRDAALGVDALPIGRLGDARITGAGSRAGAGPAAIILRLAHALARQRAGRALGALGGQRQIEIEGTRESARRGDALARQEVVGVRGALRHVVDAADRARRARIPSRARARSLAADRAVSAAHDAARADLLNVAGDVD